MATNEVKGDHERLSDVLEIKTTSHNTLRVTSETAPELFKEWAAWVDKQTLCIATPADWQRVKSAATALLDTLPDIASCDFAQDVRAIETDEERRLVRYRELVDIQHLSGLTVEESDELTALSAQVDIDMTPAHLKTPEGIARLGKNQKEWDDKTHELANALKRFINAHGYEILHAFRSGEDLITEWKALSELSEERDIRQDSYLRALVGR